MANSTGKVRVYIACSLDGFIAGPNGELDWLEQSSSSSSSGGGAGGDGGGKNSSSAGEEKQAQREEKEDKSAEPKASAGAAVTFEQVLAETGCMLMGRSTYDAVVGFDPEMWAYGNLPVHVLTHRKLPPSSNHRVTAVSGSIDDVVRGGLAAAKGKDVYVDGGNLIRQVLDAGLVDDMVVTMVPVILGQGVSLFAGASSQHFLEFYGNVKYQNMVQLHSRPINNKKKPPLPPQEQQQQQQTTSGGSSSS
mmetsp:Transcript_10758/g.20641  ORF Transcript_10758/g.20641 Transcript_10758/m.20641 type:complete len:249 (-) Transcript_10758:168-914(-)